MTSAASLYLDLLKRTLTGMVYEDPPIPAFWIDGTDYDEKVRVNGLDWPQRAPSMSGLARLDHLQQCIERVLADDVPGDLAECGVWRGGTCIFMRGVLKAHGITDRTVWVADSFQGLPTGAERSGSFAGEEQEHLSVTATQVRRNFELYGLLDKQLIFLEGWFRDTLPTAPAGPLAVLRLDGDMRTSIMESLTYLYPKLSPGGFAIVDDWRLAARAGAEEYRAAHKITESIQPVDGSTHNGEPISVYWRKDMR